MSPKKANLGQTPPTDKRAHIKRGPEAGPDLLSWRFGLADRDGPFSWESITDVELARVIRVLHEMDKLRWDAATGDGTGQIKRIPVRNLSPIAQVRLRAIRRDDEDELYEIRFGNKPRLWGIRGKSTSVFHILWWDPEHQVCPSKLRNT
jgi:hypothetical protein